MSDQPSIREALLTAKEAYDRGDYDRAEDATLHVLGQLRKERQKEVRSHAN